MSGETEPSATLGAALTIESKASRAEKRAERERSQNSHGLTTLKRAVKSLGGRVIDRRTALGKSLDGWRRDLVSDLGGSEAISVQERAIVDLAVRTKLLLDSIDSWLLVQASLVDKRRRCLLPVVRERTQLADALSRYLGQLGLKRRPPAVPSLTEYVSRRYGVSQTENAADDHGIASKR